MQSRILWHLRVGAKRSSLRDQVADGRRAVEVLVFVCGVLMRTDCFEIAGFSKFEGQICLADLTCESFQSGIVETLLLCASCDFIGWLRPQGANDSTGHSHERFRPS